MFQQKKKKKPVKIPQPETVTKYISSTVINRHVVLSCANSKNESPTPSYFAKTSICPGLVQLNTFYLLYTMSLNGFLLHLHKLSALRQEFTNKNKEVIESVSYKIFNKWTEISRV